MVPFALRLLVIAKSVEKLASSVSPDACPSPAQQWRGVGNNAGIRRTGHRFPPSGPRQALKLSWLSSAGKLRQQGPPRMTTGDTCNRPSTALGFATLQKSAAGRKVAFFRPQAAFLSQGALIYFPLSYLCTGALVMDFTFGIWRLAPCQGRCPPPSSPRRIDKLTRQPWASSSSPPLRPLPAQVERGGRCSF